MSPASPGMPLTVRLTKVMSLAADSVCVPPLVAAPSVILPPIEVALIVVAALMLRQSIKPPAVSAAAPVSVDS